MGESRGRGVEIPGRDESVDWVDEGMGGGIHEGGFGTEGGRGEIEIESELNGEGQGKEMKNGSSLNGKEVEIRR